MMPPVMSRPGVRFAGVALLALSVLAPGCGRPTDSAWLQFLGFRKSGATTAMAVLEGNLNDGTTDVADAAFKNASITVSTTDGTTGTGILITNARIDYRMSGFSPPSAEFPQNLYVPSSSTTKGTITSTEATLSGLPLATASLKQWIIDNGAFNDSVSTPTVNLTALVTFSALADDGTKLEVAGSIGIALDATGSSGSSKTVTVSATTPTATLSTPGVFTVSRSGSTTKALTVNYSVGGSATAGTDYQTLDEYVIISAGSASETISVTPISGFTDGATVIVTLVKDDTYTVGSLPKATVTLKN